MRSRLYPGVVETLDALRARGIRLCCITNKRYAFSQELLVQAGIRDRFELLLGGDSLAEKKAEPVAARSRGGHARRRAERRNARRRLASRLARRSRAPASASCSRAYGYGKIDETELGTSPRIRSFAELPAALGVG